MRPRSLGSMPKDSRKIVINWLVRLLGFTPNSTVARASAMSIGCGLKGIVAESHNQSHRVPAGPRH
jgi:hypothetical protein